MDVFTSSHMMLSCCQQCYLNLKRRFAPLLIASFTPRRGTDFAIRAAEFSTKPNPKLTDRVVFLGSDSFSVCSLGVLLKLYPHENITVIVSNEKNIIGKYSIKNQLRIMPWEEFKSTTSTGNAKFDIGVVASFGYLIPKYIIECCRMGILNVHASLLPRWRGAAPIAHAIINGDEETGVTIMQIAPHKFDVGPILHTKRIAIPEHIKAPELTNTLAHLGAEALEQVLCDIPNYLNNSRSQSHDEGKLAPRLSPEIGQIRWDSQTPIDIYNLFRGIYGHQKLRSNYDGKQADFDDLCLTSRITDPSDSNSSTVQVENFPKICDDFSVGQILFWNKLLCVKCFNPDENDRCIRNNWIFIRKIKIGKKWMSALDFHNGFLSKTKGSHYFSYISESEPKEIKSSSRSGSSSG